MAPNLTESACGYQSDVVHTLKLLTIFAIHYTQKVKDTFGCIPVESMGSIDGAL